MRYCNICRFFAVLRYLSIFSAVLRCSALPNVPLFKGTVIHLLSESIRPRVISYSKIDLGLSMPGWFWWMESNTHRARTTYIQHHLARLLKYYPRTACAPTFSKSAKLRIVQTHSSLFLNSLYEYTRGMLGCLLGALPGQQMKQKRRKSNQMECATTSWSQQVHDREVMLKLNQTRTPTWQVYCIVTVKKHLRSSSYENNVLNLLWCRSLMMKTINNRSKDELVSGRGTNSW